MATPLHKNLSPEGHEIYSFGRSFLLSSLLFSLSNLIYAQEYRKKLKKEIMKFHYKTYMAMF